MNLRIKKMFSWGLISFFTTTAITHAFVGNWFQTIFIATISVLPEIFEFTILKKKKIIQSSRIFKLTPKEIVRK